MTTSPSFTQRLTQCALALAVAAMLAACGGDGGISKWRERVFTPPAPITAQDQAEMLRQINAVRAQPRRCDGRLYPAAPAVRWNPELAQIATLHAQDMADSSPKAASMELLDRANKHGYSNNLIARAYSSSGSVEAQDAIEKWATSEFFCAGLMSGLATEIGLGRGFNVNSESGRYWALIVGTRR